jgi:hypothetical protein
VSGYSFAIAARASSRLAPGVVAELPDGHLIPHIALLLCVRAAQETSAGATTARS